MHICNLDGLSATYFSANRQGHIENCPFGSSNDFNSTKYKEEDFIFESALEALTMNSKSQTKRETPNEHKNGVARPRPPRTIRQIYSM
jgi:hypothetical protein